MWNIIGRRPIVYLLLVYLTGIAAAMLFSPPLSACILISLFFIAISLIAFYLNPKRPTLFIILFTGIILAGLLNYQYSAKYLPKNHISKNFKDGTYKLAGRLIKPPIKFTHKSVIIIQAERIKKSRRWIKTSGKVRLSLYKQNIQLNYGDSISVKAGLRLPKNFNNPGGFDYKTYLKRQGIRVIGTVYSDKYIKKLAPVKVNLLFLSIYKLKKRLSAFIGRTYPDKSAGFLKALLLGERTAVSPYIKDEFTRVGLAHLLAISGLHVGFVSFIFFSFFSFLLRLLPNGLFEYITGFIKPSKIAAIFTIFPLIIYTILVGARTATMRAAIMITAYILSLLADRQRDWYNTLALAALLILIYRPVSILEIDFQLSFITVFFIIYAVYFISSSKDKKPILAPLGHWDKLKKWLTGYIFISLTAWLSACGLIVYYFNRLSWVGIIANLIALPLVWLIIPLGLLSGGLSFVNLSCAKLISQLNLIFIKLLLNLVHNMAGFSFAAIRMPSPSIFQLIIYYALLYFLFKAWRKNWARWAVLGLSIVSIGCYIYPSFNSVKDNFLRVIFLDAGRGDCVFIEFPGGKNMLIDAGSFYKDGFDIGERIVSPFLWSKGIKRLDWAVLSRDKTNYIRSLNSVIKNFIVGRLLYIPLKKHKSDTYSLFKRELKSSNISEDIIGAGDSLVVQPGITLSVIYPPLANKSRIKNDNSLVLKLSYDKVSFLFCGNLGKRAEKYLLKKPALLSSAILRITHDKKLNFNTSSFLKAVKPEIAVLSIPDRPHSGFLNADILKKYEKKQVKILQTNLQGAITVKTDGKVYCIEHFKDVT